jgi:hypothetical protein
LTSREKIKIIEKYCLSDDLSTYDPYDIWKNRLGLKVKKLYGKNKYIGLIPAGILSVFDLFFNNKLRLFYSKQEYPIVRAQAAITLLNVYNKTGENKHLDFAKKHIDWLIENYSKGFSGICWGLGFEWDVDAKIKYSKNTPFSTHTPYVLEAIHCYIEVTNDKSYIQYIESIYLFYKYDLKYVNELDTRSVSYGPYEDRFVTNATSYALYAYSIFSLYIKTESQSISDDINKFYNYLVKNQGDLGQWLYDINDKFTFIDCFHSCFVLKNILKSNKISPLLNCESVAYLGYNYLVQNFFKDSGSLAVRFSRKNKPSVIKYDLYDNSELLNVAILLNDKELIHKLSVSIETNFVKREEIFSIIDLFSFRHNKNMLRWAVMPYLNALSKS